MLTPGNKKPQVTKKEVNKDLSKKEKRVTPTKIKKYKKTVEKDEYEEYYEQ